MHCILFALYMYFDMFIYKVQSNYRGLMYVVEYKVQYFFGNVVMWNYKEA